MSQTVDTSFDAEAAPGPLRVRLAGQDFTAVENPPVGAIVVFSRRLQKDDQERLGGVLELLERWIVPEEHDALMELIGGLHQEALTQLMDTDLAEAIQTIAARPTSAS